MPIELFYGQMLLQKRRKSVSAYGTRRQSASRRALPMQYWYLLPTKKSATEVALAEANKSPEL